jgi:hypothetical protein
MPSAAGGQDPRPTRFPIGHDGWGLGARLSIGLTLLPPVRDHRLISHDLDRYPASH